MNEYFPIISLILNVLIIPLLAMMWGIRIDLARLTAMMDSQDKRISRLETLQDKHLGGLS